MKVELKVPKLELLEWYVMNDVELSITQKTAYKEENWVDFYNSGIRGVSKEKEMLDTWFEVVEEIDYSSWIDEWCVFSDKIIDKYSLGILLSKLIKFETKNNYPFTTRYDEDYRYCMLLTDYQKMIKEQE